VYLEVPEMASKNKTIVVKTVEPENETHMQIMKRLGIGGGFVFAHGTPQKRVKKSH
jgi:hypothetical protein